MRKDFLPLLFLGALFFVPSLFAEDELSSASGGEGPSVNDPLYRSFAEAFDEVLAETAPDLRTALNSEPEDADPVISAILAADAASWRDKLQSAIFSALSCEKEPGAKARRSFLFARGENGLSDEYHCLETGGDFDMTPGEILFTGRPLDAAIDRNSCAFFILEKEGDPEPYYSRAGDFRADREGFLYLEKKGERYHLTPRVTNPEQISRLAVFPNPSFLASEESVLFRAAENAGPVSFLDLKKGEDGALISCGYLEGSNAHLDLLFRLWNDFEGRSSLVQKENIP